MPASPELKRIEAENRYALIVETSNQADSPDYRCASYGDQMKPVRIVRDVMGGTDVMCEAGETYLPKHPSEETDDYDRRLKRAKLFNATARTVDGLTGMIFRKDPILEDATERIAAELENVDNAGRDLAVFAKDVTRNALADGHTWILVEYPNTEGVRSRADELERGVRPYWVNLLKQDVINWRYEIRSGSPFLTLLVCREDTMVAEGMYGEAKVERVRVMEPGSWALYEKRKGQNQKERWELIEEGSTSLTYIPAIPVYAKKEGHYVSTPPLLDLAHENIEHWQVRSDHRHALMFASVPIPVFTGVDPEEAFEWGPNRSLIFPNADSAASMLESSGASLAESRSELRDIEGRMAALGLSMLVRETRAAETAEAKRIDKAVEDSALAFVARAVETALNRALEIHAEYRSEGEAARVFVNRDFMDRHMDPQLLQQLREMVASGQLPLEELWIAMQEGEALREEFDAEDALERLEDIAPDLQVMPADAA